MRVGSSAPEGKVNNLFYNWSVRQQAYQPKQDIYKLRDMSEKYTVHHASMYFSYISYDLKLSYFTSK